VAIYAVNVIIALRRGEAAGANPWNAATLEWATASPPPSFNFLVAPAVGSRDPVWTDPPDMPLVVGVRADKRQVLVTRMLDAEPDHRLHSPGPSLWPFWSAVATTGLFIGSIFTPWAVVWGSIPVTVALIGWFWPRAKDIDDENRMPATVELRQEEAGGAA
jgi:cytochrome c oxidase subunit 1